MEKMKRIFFIIVGVLIFGFVTHFVIDYFRYQNLVKQANTNAQTFVQTIKIDADSNQQTLTLPGTIQGINEAQIYSRANGYVKKWYKDIGEPVKTGDLLAVIEIPEVEKQVDEAQTNFNLAKKAYQRWQKLREADAVTQQEFDEKTNAYFQTEAVLKRVKDQLQFRELKAPFDGIVTKRNINVGDLVNTGNTGAGSALYVISQNQHLKVYAYVPQNLATKVYVGMPVEITNSEQPDLKIAAKVTKVSSAVDTATRTMQVEILLPDDSNLLPGYYVQTNFHFDNLGKIIIPTKTLLFGPKGVEVATVKNGVVDRKVVTIGNDFGDKVEITSGVDASDELISNPPEAITSGQKVTVAPKKSDKTDAK